MSITCRRDWTATHCTPYAYTCALTCGRQQRTPHAPSWSPPLAFGPCYPAASIGTPHCPTPRPPVPLLRPATPRASHAQLKIGKPFCRTVWGSVTPPRRLARHQNCRARSAEACWASKSRRLDTGVCDALLWDGADSIGAHRVRGSSRAVKVA